MIFNKKITFDYTLVNSEKILDLDIKRTKVDNSFMTKEKLTLLINNLMEKNQIEYY